MLNLTKKDKIDCRMSKPRKLPISHISTHHSCQFFRTRKNVLKCSNQRKMPRGVPFMFTPWHLAFSIRRLAGIVELCGAVYYTVHTWMSISALSITGDEVGLEVAVSWCSTFTSIEFSFCIEKARITWYPRRRPRPPRNPPRPLRPKKRTRSASAKSALAGESKSKDTICTF